MSVLQRIGNMFKTQSSTNDKSVLDKIELLNQIDTLSKLAASVLDALQKPGVIKSLIKVQTTGVQNQSDSLKQLQAIYKTYFQKLSAHYQQAERNTVFSVMVDAIEQIIVVLHQLTVQFDTLFDGIEDSSIKLTDITISMAAIVGWLNLVNNYFSWIIYFVCNLNSTERMPPYQMIFLTNNVDMISTYTVFMANRISPSTNFLSMLENIRKEGIDLHLTTNGQTIDAYASDKEYTSEILDSLDAFGFRNPVIIIGNHINQFRLWWIDSNKAKREWLASRVGYLTLQAQGLDPNSPEAIRLQNIIRRYGDMVASYDKKLGVGTNE